MRPSGWEVEPLNAGHSTDGFDCGEPSLSAYLASHALSNAQRGIGRTYVLCAPDSKDVIGYYTVSAGSIVTESAPKKARSGTPYSAMPTLHLGRLAVRRDRQGRGLGEFLLMHAMALAERIAAAVGVQLLEVRALDDSARRFYMKYDFAPLQDDESHLYITLKKIRRLSLNEPS